MPSSSSPEFILTSSPDGSILAYLASTGDSVAHFTNSRSPRGGLTVVGKGLIAASYVSDTAVGSIRLYNWYCSTVFHYFPVPEPVAPLTATRDGAYLFAGGLSGSIHSLSLPSGDIVKSYRAHKKSISSLQLNDDGSLVISGSDDGNIVVIPTFRLVEALADEKDPKDLVLYRLKAHSNSVTALHTAIGLCNSTLISCSLDCTCKFWSLGCGALLRTVTFPCSIFGVAIDQTESEFYAAGSDGLVYKGSMMVGSRKLLHKAHEVVNWSKSHNGSILSLVLVNEGMNLVSAAEDGSVWMWEVEKGEVCKVLATGTLGSISDMIVATTGTNDGVRGSNNASAVNDFTFSGLCDQEVSNSIKQIIEVGEAVNGVIEDKKSAIDMLESAITTYERLLKLILKEAMTRATSSSSAEAEAKEEKEKSKGKEK